MVLFAQKGDVDGPMILLINRTPHVDVILSASHNVDIHIIHRISIHTRYNKVQDLKCLSGFVFKQCNASPIDYVTC